MKNTIAIVISFIPTFLSSAEQTQCYFPPVDKTQHQCLTTMVYGEARGEAIKGKVAVAYTALNRAGKSTVCKVVLAPKQYSVFNNNSTLKSVALNKNAKPVLKNKIDKASWAESADVAKMVLNKEVVDPTKGATHYLAPKEMTRLKYKMPKWSKQYKVVAVIDNHKFYKKENKLKQEM